MTPSKYGAWARLSLITTSVKTPFFLELTPEFWHIPMLGYKVLVLNTKWYLGLQSTTFSECSTNLCQWPGTNAWGLSVNTDIRGGGNGGLNKLLYDATPNSDTYHFRFRCEEKSPCSVEWEIRRSHGSFLNSFFNLFTWMIFVRFYPEFFNRYINCHVIISSMSILRTCMNFPINCKIKVVVLGD